MMGVGAIVGSSLISEMVNYLPMSWLDSILYCTIRPPFRVLFPNYLYSHEHARDITPHTEIFNVRQQ
jgi:hypothetical protein